MALAISLNLECFAESGSGTPLKYISSCEIDLNNDDEVDITLLVETVRGRELIALIKIENGYKAYLLSKGKEDMQLSCHFGREIKETSTGKGKRKGKVYEINGAYIKLTLPESSSVVYFWTDSGFKEVWTSS